jgi:hypothetical protein
MKQAIAHLNASFNGLEGQLSAATNSSQAFVSRLEARAIERQRKNIYHGLGQRIKLLIDTPEEVSQSDCIVFFSFNRYGTR